MSQQQEGSESNQRVGKITDKSPTNKVTDCDRALNRANSERMGEEIRHDPYAGRETIGPANSKNVSPNTPKGEEV